MENFEGHEFEQKGVQPAENQQPQYEPQPKASPFADSPYIMNNADSYQNRQQTDGANPWQPYAQPQPKPKKGTGKKILKTVVSALLILCLLATGCGVTAWMVNEYWEERNGDTDKLLQQMGQQIEDLREYVEENAYTGQGNSVSGTPNEGTDGSLTPAQVYAQCRKNVVAISNQVTTNIFGQISETASSGSGFIISQDGYVVTNYHVAEGANKLTVITYDGTEHTAKLVGYDSSYDLAVLKIEATGLTAAKLGSSDDLIVGDQVVAIGNPLGELTNSLTVGYISAKDRSVTTDGTTLNMLQTDAAINSGNSGGPLFNMKGEVVGITTAKYTGTTSSGAVIESIGFAIPMDDVVKKINDLVNVGYITGAYLGVYVRDMDPSLVNYGIPLGAYVEEATEGYCAKEAGVQSKDIIVALGDYEVDSLNGLTRALDNFNPGDTTTITVWRSGVELELEITLDEKPAQNSQD